MTQRFLGKSVLVTGGANGMGLACAQRFAAEGASVMIADLLEESGRAAVASIVAGGGSADFVHADMCVEADCRAAVGRAIERFGRIDHLVLAAGIPTSRYRSGGPDPRKPGVDPLQAFIDAPAEDWDEVLGVNVRGGYFVLQEVVRDMLPRGSGSIVVITSTAAQNQSNSGAIPYSVSKAGAWAMVKHLARLVAPRGIRVNAVGPGLIDTNMSRGYLADPQKAAAVMTQIPMGRAGTPDDIASSVLFLCSDEAGFITGEALYVDGGQFTS